MKQYLITLFGIVLLGSPTVQQLQSVKKYDAVFSQPVEVYVVNQLTHINEQGRGWVGQAIWQRQPDNTKRYYRAEVMGSLDDYAFEFVLLHEIGHLLYSFDEKQADNYSYNILNFIKTL